MLLPAIENSTVDEKPTNSFVISVQQRYNTVNRVQGRFAITVNHTPCHELSQLYRRMIELPLFPLNTVLFPGMPLELHIFEERYKLMIGECIERRTPFGIVLLEEGRSELDFTGLPPQVKPFLVGCTAQIMQVNALPEGRMNITVVGRERFQIQELHHDHPYLRGTVEMYPLEPGSSSLLAPVALLLRRWVSRYLSVLERSGQLHFDASQLPEDPSTIGYLAAVLLQGVSMRQKQELLAASSLLRMLVQLCRLYRREVTLLEMLVDPPDFEDMNPTPFSLN